MTLKGVWCHHCTDAPRCTYSFALPDSSLCDGMPIMTTVAELYGSEGQPCDYNLSMRRQELHRPFG